MPRRYRAVTSFARGELSANAITRSKIEQICRTAGFEPPVICTPVELVEEETL
jgi:hypothetical protein